MTHLKITYNFICKTNNNINLKSVLLKTHFSYDLMIEFSDHFVKFFTITNELYLF